MKQILVIYYSQSGQLKEISDNLLSSLVDNVDYNVTYKEIEPVKPYPFPWDSESFFDVFPESVLGVTCDIKEIDFGDEKYDLIILAHQIWYLSPSIPFWSFLQDDKYKHIFKDTNVITLVGARNMWVMSLKEISKRLKEIGAKHVGNIVFIDKHNNLVSVLTIEKWMYTANKGPYKTLPEAGVSAKEINEASKFGYIIENALKCGNFDNFQEEVVAKGGVPINFAIKTAEQNGKRIFKIWAKKIIKKEGDKRLFLLRVFKYYLLFLIFVLSPIAYVLFMIIYYLLYPITNKKLSKITLLRL